MIGILGGTFDPIHYAHLRLAVEVQERLQLQQVRLLPSAQPPHRTTPSASAEQRLKMLQLALQDAPKLCADDRELRRSGASYMVDTLIDLRQGLGAECVLGLIVGMDAFAGLPSWHRWESLFELANIILVNRAGVSFPDSPLLHEIVDTRRATADEFKDYPAGKIIQLDINIQDISATALREIIQQKRSPAYLTPLAVQDFIQQQGLYCG